MFGKKETKPDNMTIQPKEEPTLPGDLPELNKPEQLEELPQPEITQVKKDFIEVQSAALIGEGLYQYVIVSNREFKLGLMEE